MASVGGGGGGARVHLCDFRASATSLSDMWGGGGSGVWWQDVAFLLYESFSITASQAFKI